ncbi:MAG: hypothetical protein D6761_12510 [Candidatus Dadabacteria bacterium]|nr:MAG: hypothetical protein D6761_12510 [Candidatus Dadabacteria bacterium]
MGAVRDVALWSVAWCLCALSPSAIRSSESGDTTISERLALAEERVAALEAMVEATVVRPRLLLRSEVQEVELPVIGVGGSSVVAKHQSGFHVRYKLAVSGPVFPGGVKVRYEGADCTGELYLCFGLTDLAYLIGGPNQVFGMTFPDGTTGVYHLVAPLHLQPRSDLRSVWDPLTQRCEASTFSAPLQCTQGLEPVDDPEKFILEGPLYVAPVT